MRFSLTYRAGQATLIIPHLIFAHLLGDYALQTDWLAARKSQAWDGLLLHGAIVWVMSVIALSPYLNHWEVVLALVTLGVVHTSQDGLKVWSGPRLRLHLSIPYMADQVSHIVLIVILQLALGDILSPPPTEIFIMALGASLIFVTRFYDVSWWANWFEMIIYMNRWRTWAYIERLLMLFCASLGIGGALVAPLIALPRLYYAWRIGAPLWKQNHGLLEWSLGIVFCVGLGYLGLHQIIQYYDLGL